MHFFIRRFWIGIVAIGTLLCHVKVHAQCATPISAFPYVEDFEASNGGWTAGGTLSDWAWGTPAKPVIHTAGSGTKCWITGGLTTSFYGYGEKSYLQSPCFDFTNLQHPFIAFLIYRESEWKFDGGNLQYSLDQGTTWTNVGSINDATDCMDANWYNYSPVTYLTSPLSPVRDGWCGNSLANSTESGVACQGGNGSLGWVQAKHCMQNLAGKPQVIFRFTFAAGTTCNHFDGLAFDSISISEAVANTGNFTYNCTNARTVSFTGTAGLPCTDTLSWNFGDPASGGANTVTGATPTHTFSATGQHVVTLTIKGGPCNAPATITKTIDILSVSTTVQSVTCFGGSNGAINVTTTGGTGTYTYNWGAGITSQNRTGLTSGTYIVTVSDPQSCPATASATVNQPAVVAGTSTNTGAGCNGGANGSITITPTGGTGPYTYNWGGGITGNPRNGLAAGTYTVTITDSKGCTGTASGTVTQSSPIAATLTPSNSTCTGNTGGVTLTITNGGTLPDSYLWSNGATTQNLTSVGGDNYIVTITDAQGCSATASTQVGQNGAPAITATTVQITCNNNNDGQVNTTINGGSPNYTYIWSSTQTTQNINNLAAGTYTVTVHDAQNCSATASGIIINPQPVVVTLTPQNETCFGNSNATITSNVTGGTPNYTYLWGNTATTANLSGLTAGPYAVTVTDQNQCTGSASATISQPTQLTASATSTNATCFGQANGTVTLTVAGGTNPDNYLWSNAATTQNLTTVTGTATYSVTVTDINLCTATASATVTSPTQIVIQGTPYAATCFGYTNGKITTTENGGAGSYTYLWSNNASTQNLTNVTNGSYTVTVTDASGCTASASFTITAPLAITISNTPTEVSCFGGTNGAITVIATGGSGSGYTYVWSNASTSTAITNLIPGSYTLTVTDGNACTQSATYTITQPGNVVLTATPTPQSCASKSDGTVTVTTNNGGTPPFSYAWSNQGTTATISNLNASTYYVTVTDANQCTYPDSAIVNILAPLTFTDTTVAPVCPPINTGSISVLNISGGTAPYSFSWNGQPGFSTLSNLAAGYYYLLVTDANGCSVPDSFNLQYQYNISVTAGPGSTIQLGNHTEITCTSNPSTGLSYNWTPGEGLDCSTCQTTGAQPVRTMFFYITVQDSNGCTANDSVLVTVIPNYDLFIPNAFTPNGDGNNDYFEVFGNKAAIIYWQVEVFNRWGEKVFESNDINFGWDGTYKGKLQDPGVFIYEAKVTFLDDHTRNNYKGSLTLIR